MFGWFKIKPQTLGYGEEGQDRERPITQQRVDELEVINKAVYAFLCGEGVKLKFFDKNFKFEYSEDDRADGVEVFFKDKFLFHIFYNDEDYSASSVHWPIIVKMAEMARYEDKLTDERHDKHMREQREALQEALSSIKE